MNDAQEVGTADEGPAGLPVGAPVTIPDYAAPPARPAPAPLGALAVVAVKIVGLCCFVQALPGIYVIPTHLISMATGQSATPAVVYLIVDLLHPVAYLAVGVVLVRRATWIATRILGFESPSEVPGLPAPGRRLQAVAFSVVGVWLIVRGIADAVWVFTQAHRDSRGNDVIQSAFDDPATLAPVAAELALGAWLFLGAERLASFWHRYRMRPVRAGAARPGPL